ncbi:MAG: MAPEG family protein [Rhizobiaceae bacterium]
MNSAFGKIIVSSLLPVGIFILVAAGVYVVLPVQEVPLSATERALATLIELRWPVLVLLAMVITLFRGFDTPQAADPLAGGESGRHRINQRVLQNSLEQFVLFVPVVLALAALAQDGIVWHGVRTAVLVFTLGRLLFWVGYHRSPPGRAPGFVMTFFTNLVVLGAVFWLAF